MYDQAGKRNNNLQYQFHDETRVKYAKTERLRLVSGGKLLVQSGQNDDRFVSLSLAARVALHTVRNILLRRPLCIALEVTHNCCANCRHCDKGGQIAEQVVNASAYKMICEEIDPVVIQISGGEPLLRDDLTQIVKALYRLDRTPFLVLVTNGFLLTEEKYIALREAGIGQFSISLDFPDYRHDDFRRIPGLFGRLDRLIPELISTGNEDIIINTCITRANYLYLPDIVARVADWGAKLNFSAYTDLRTHDKDLNLRHPEDTRKFKRIIDDLYSGNHRQYVMTSEKVMRRFAGYFENCYMPNCQSGRNFLIVNPDGRLTPCAMHAESRFVSRKELLQGFTISNRCGHCYISIRANTEKPVHELFIDNLRFARSLI